MLILLRPWMKCFDMFIAIYTSVSYNLSGRTVYPFISTYQHRAKAKAHTT